MSQTFTVKQQPRNRQDEALASGAGSGVGGRKRTRSTLIGVTISLAVTVLLSSALVVLDLHLHSKFDAVGGLNYRGYRGAILGSKAPDEVRIGLFGGSIAMGYGVKNEVSIAAFLEQTLNSEANGAPRYRVANLATNGEGSVSYFKANYELFRHLDLDVLLFYEALRELASPPAYGADRPEWGASKRSADPFMRAFGYYFILPLVVREKYYLTRYGDISKGYLEDRLFSWFDRASPGQQSRTATASLGQFVEDVVRENKTVVLALSPGDSGLGKRVRASWEERFGRDRRIIVADLDGVFLPEERASYLIDNAHYSEKGNRVIAEAIARRYIRP